MSGQYASYWNAFLCNFYLRKFSISDRIRFKMKNLVIPGSWKISLGGKSCKVYLYHLVILLGSYIYSTTNTLDTIEAFIAETMYNLSLPNLMCYSTSCLCLCNCCCDCSAATLESEPSYTVLYGGLNSCSCRC